MCDCLLTIILFMTRYSASGVVTISLGLRRAKPLTLQAWEHAYFLTTIVANALLLGE